jgi:hypothetical protein
VLFSHNESINTGAGIRPTNTVTVTQILNSVPARQFYKYFSALHRFVPSFVIFIERFGNQEVKHILAAIYCV